jgi:glycosyltransferase involved in cell wall biosynthesis
MKRSFARRVATKSRTYLRRATDRLEAHRKVAWPTSATSPGGKVAAVTVNYNTVDLIKHLIYSLHSTGTASQFSSFTVVDNGSDDGSLDYLEALAARELIVLLRNAWPPYHGPALNRAFSHLAASSTAQEIERVWVLDSDTVVLRTETLQEAMDAARASDAAILGEFAPESAKQSSKHVMLFSMLVDPSRVWSARMPVFQEHGLPSDAIQAAALENGWFIEGFPFASGEYVLHLGGATITTVTRDGRRGNAYFSRSTEDQSDDVPSSRYSFQGVPTGPQLYRSFLDDYEPRAGSLDPDGFADVMVRLRDRSA